MGVWKKAKKWASDFFDQSDVSPALALVWLLVAVIFFVSNREVHLKVLAGGMILLLIIQLVRMASRRRTRKGLRRK